MACKLQRSLHGLKQAPQAWFDKFRKTLLLVGFRQSQCDPSLFLSNASQGITLLLVYVDDIIISGNDLDNILQLQQSLHASFRMNNIGPLTYFLGPEVHRIQGGLFINQHKYTQDLISQAHLQNTTAVDTP